MTSQNTDNSSWDTLYTVREFLYNFFEFDVHVTVHRDKFLKLNQLDALISQIYFWNETLHVSDSSSVHHKELFTVHAAMVYVSKPV